MTDQAPFDARLAARILRRAVDRERAGIAPDRVSPITEAALLAAAAEVGLSAAAVRRSIAVERLGAPPARRAGDRIVGPSQVVVDGELDVPAGDALARVDAWLVAGHHLRRDLLRAGRGEWSRRPGLIGTARRTIGAARGEGRLGDVDRISASVQDTGDGSSMVRVTLDRAADRRRTGTGAGVIGAGGLAGAAVGAIVAAPVVLVASPVVVIAGIGVALTGRKRSRESEREIGRLLEAARDAPVPGRGARRSLRTVATARPAITP